MAFFKFRLPGSKAETRASSTGPVESIEGLRRRARHRLIGAAVLVLAAVVGFPLVFDTQPRPVAVDVAIQIPDRNKVKPLSVASAPADAAPAAVPPAASAPVRAASTPAPAPSPAASAPTQVPARASLDAKEEIVAPGSDKKADKPVAKQPDAAIPSEAKASPPTPKAEAKPEPKPEPKPAAKPVDDGSRAQALLEGKEAPAPKPAASDSGRFIVQVGAFADAAKAKETRLKVERAGLTTYIHVAETPEGKRTRVRVGPFSNRADAEKAAAKIRGLDLPAAILTL